MKKNKMEKYFAKGQVLFVQTKDGLKENRYDRDYYMEEYKSRLGTATENYVNYLYDSKFTYKVYNLMSGKKFLKQVLEGYFMDGDGSICEIFIDGFKSNLGLFTDKLISGEGCLLDEDSWKKLCDIYNVEVNWANK